MPDPSPSHRIVVTGSESTGKTALARALAAHLGAPWVEEYARLYALEVKRPLDARDVDPIARGQIAAEDAILRGRPPIVVLDTDLVSTTVYARHYYGNVPDWIESTARSRLGDLYLFLDIDLPWIGDGVRDQPRSRDVIHALFERQLAALGARVVPIRGVGAARLEAALRAIQPPPGAAR